MHGRVRTHKVDDGRQTGAEMKKTQKSAKKVLTNARECSILTELSAREQLEAGTMILENDTE